MVAKEEELMSDDSELTNELSVTAKHDCFLEQDVQGLTAPSWAVFSGPPGYKVYVLTGVESGTRADFGLSAKTSGLHVASLDADSASSTPSVSLDGVQLYGDPPAKPDELELRRTVAFVLPKLQALAAMPYVSPIEGSPTLGASYITLDRMVLGLAVGRPVMVSGLEADSSTGTTGVMRWEVAVLKDIVHAAGRTTLCFEEALAYRYQRSSCTINANVVLATHGETVAAEILGSGDGSQANQMFMLRKSPLTYVPANTPRGSESTLDIRVNGILWSETESLYQASPRAQSYVVRLGDDASTTVEFGDGTRGARLPTGQENLIATYRTGIGPAGNVRARTLSLLLNPPLGIRSVVNPIAASGGAPPEQLADARHNAPLKVLTLERIVSLSDFEDFTRGFAGIGKARAEAIWSGERRIVFISVVDANGQPLDPDLPLYQSLVAALHSFSDDTDDIEVGSIDPGTQRLRTFIERRFKIAAEVGVDPTYDGPTVLANVKATLTDGFGFAARELGQHVTEAEVVAAIQQVPGVVFTRLTQLGDASAPLLPDGGVLIAASAQWMLTGNTRWIRPAELLLASANGITVKGTDS